MLKRDRQPGMFVTFSTTQPVHTSSATTESVSPTFAVVRFVARPVLVFRMPIIPRLTPRIPPTIIVGHVKMPLFGTMSVTGEMLVSGKNAAKHAAIPTQSAAVPMPFQCFRSTGASSWKEGGSVESMNAEVNRSCEAPAATC
jgi:hypothetical protein